MPQMPKVIDGEHVIFHFRADMEPNWHVQHGDTLMFEIIEIQLARSVGTAHLIPGFGLLKERTRRAVTRLVRIEDGIIHFRGLRIPVRTMIGTIGVAPAHGVWSEGGHG